jgi:P-type E1-E2 ATPase
MRVSRAPIQSFDKRFNDLLSFKAKYGHCNEEVEVAKSWLDGGGTVGFMSIEGYGIVCSYCVADAVRKEAKMVVAEFRKLGIEVNMLTGDNAKAASSIGERLGLTVGQIKSNLFPDEKLRLVKRMIEMEQEAATKKSCRKTPGLILMCGDGVNDAPALALADVGVAMGAGAALAMETADVTTQTFVTY